MQVNIRQSFFRQCLQRSLFTKLFYRQSFLPYGNQIVNNVSREGLMCVNKMGAPTVTQSDSDGEYETLDMSIFTAKPKLPKIVLPKFNGEITKFQAF